MSERGAPSWASLSVAAEMVLAQSLAGRVWGLLERVRRLGCTRTG